MSSVILKDKIVYIVHLNKISVYKMDLNGNTEYKNIDTHQPGLIIAAALQYRGYSSHKSAAL
jgi:hypothetical protein